MCILKIENIRNGYLLHTKNYDEEGKEYWVKEAIIEDGSPEGELKCARELLQKILYELGESGSKHDPARVRVVIARKKNNA